MTVQTTRNAAVRVRSEAPNRAALAARLSPSARAPGPTPPSHAEMIVARKNVRKGSRTPNASNASRRRVATTTLSRATP